MVLVLVVGPYVTQNVGLGEVKTKIVLNYEKLI